MKVYIGFENDEKEAIYREKLETYKEKWRRIILDGVKTDYRISNWGRLKNVKTKNITDFFNRRTRYYLVNFNIKGKRYNIGVHRLVAMYFCKIPKRHEEAGLTFKDLVPNHKDGIKHHNAAFNLEWVTQKENMDHAFREKLCIGIFGEKSHLAKITEKDAIEICELIMQRKNNQEIHDIMKEKGVDATKKTIQHIRSKECWRKVSMNYNFPKLAEDLRNTISDETVYKICEYLEMKKFSDTEIAKMCNVRREYVKSIRTRTIKKEFTKQFNF